jgi:hypothetical protein
MQPALTKRLRQRWTNWAIMRKDARPSCVYWIVCVGEHHCSSRLQATARQDGWHLYFCSIG